MLAIQTAIGGSTSKAVSMLNLSFDDMINMDRYQYGFNSDGIYLLNNGGDGEFASSFTFATSDFGISKPKHIRFIYLGIDTSNSFKVSVKVDNGTFEDYTVSNLKSGLQRLRIPIKSTQQGRYFTIKVSSSFYFRLEEMDCAFYVRSSGIRGY